MSAPDGLTRAERQVWRGLAEAFRAWRERPDETRAKSLVSWGVLAKTTPAPLPRERAAMETVFTVSRAARGWKAMSPAAREEEWLMVAPALAHLEAHLAEAVAPPPAAEVEPWWQKY